MNNAIFLLTDNPIEIERLHICTWDMHGDGAIEIGMEFGSQTWQKASGINAVSFTLSLPFLGREDKVSCLSSTLVGVNNANNKFIFNDTVHTTHTIKGEPANGSVVMFSNRNPLAILPIHNEHHENGVITFNVNNLDILGDHNLPNTITAYVRVLIRTKLEKFVVIHSGIAKTSYQYDLKINEMRNIPEHINNLVNNGKHICKTIKSCFCMHVIPSDYGVTYADANKLKNTRILESEAFNRYISGLNAKDNEYVILFQKDQQKIGMGNNSANGDSYSFFTEFEKERIGNKQIIVSIGVNLLCSLIVGVANSPGTTILAQWCKNWEIKGILILIGALILYLLLPWGKLGYRIKRWWKTDKERSR